MKDFLEHDDESHHHDKDKKCRNCICEMLEDIREAQEEVRNRTEDKCCSLNDMEQRPIHDTIPFLLQTPYGHPYFTWGKVGTEHCFVTVFFSVVKVDCEENCAVLRLLKPNASLIDPDTDSVEPALICNVDFVTKTNECVLVDLSCFSALKCLSPKFIKNKQ
ncbi:CotY/CotZ family spore coat protein [Ornithinibacillus californiensis]|uniref:CotY/CotZ family spore coat protein n=1 Tax=Ornithinibacillus californiensis TaxID=161536 RepID=UPI001F319E94|nr:CotY/CotZ family spore coat protein [Ornithinibacillus californiensis]